jgi:hypothetical protein
VGVIASRLVLAVILPSLILAPARASAWELVPTEAEIQKYRKSWNPFSHGPILLQAVDIQPKGQFSARPFLFTQVGERSFGNQLSFASDDRAGPVHLYALNPSVNATYGLTNHIELGAAASYNQFWARSSEDVNNGRGGPMTTHGGLGDSSLIVKYRPIVQDPDTWRPSVTLFSQVVLPTSKWAKTQRPPGGFTPLGRLPNTRFGELGITEGVMYRKILKPFRISAATFYTYSAPGSEGATTTYTGDVINTRLIFEHILDDKRGLGYNIEFSGLHGLTFRADGHAINRGQQSGFTILGIEPAIQWRFGDSNFVAATGVLFTVAGQNASNSFYPNFSLFWYWNKTGKVIMR